VRSTGSKPPGTSTFNIEPAEEVISSDDQIEVLEGLPLGAISMGDWDDHEVLEQRPPVVKMAWPGLRSDWRNHTPYWMEPGIHARNQIGDCYAMVADMRLTQTQPFPGDEIYDLSTITPELRFSVTKHVNGDMYSIYDRLVEERVMLAESLLQKSQFDIS
jgi:hypothetical protein